MRFIGNYQQWINPSWLTEIKNQPGYGRPRDWQPAFAHEEIEYIKAEQAGYQLNDVHFWLYEKSNLSFDLTPPWTTGEVHWWFTKMYPGQFTPMHQDPHTVGEQLLNIYNQSWLNLQVGLTRSLGCKLSISAALFNSPCR